MSVQPEDIGSSASPVGVWVSDVVSEYLAIAERAAAPFPVAGEVHRTRDVAIVETIARAAVGSGLGVVADIKEF